MTQKFFNLPTTLILTAALAASLGLWLSGKYFFIHSPQMPPLTSALLYPQPRDIPDFQLTQSDGSIYSKESWRGHWNLLFFGFTSCPDICPSTLNILRNIDKKTKKSGKNLHLRFDFISVDPERDFPQQLDNYTKYFSPDFRAATGTHEELTKLTRSLGVIYSRTQDLAGKIEVDHSASILLINPEGRLLGMFRPPLLADAIANDLEILMSGVF